MQRIQINLRCDLKKKKPHIDSFDFKRRHANKDEANRISSSVLFI